MHKVVSVLLGAMIAGMACGSPRAADNGERGSAGGTGSESNGQSWRKEREQMLKNQIQRRGVKDPAVLSAIEKVPRHRFVPEDQQAQAYGDHPLPIGHGQTISQPYIVALMTELLQPEPSDTVLEIGTGSGYQAAVLAEIVAHVYTIEIVEPLAERARRTLEREGYDNVSVMAGDGYGGWPEHAPFDGVILTAAPPEVPQPLIDQLAEGGRLVAPVGKLHQELVVYEKKGGEIERREVIPVRFVPMTGKAGGK